MPKPQGYKIGDKVYYLASEVKDIYPVIFKGVTTSMTKFIDKYNLAPVTDYIYARLNGNQYVEQLGSISRKYDKLFLRRNWVKSKVVIKKDNAEINTQEVLIQKICLDQEEKLCDSEGNIVEIEVRGERNPDKVYFKVSDVADGFGIKSLNVTITGASNYLRGEDYVCLTRSKYDNDTLVLSNHLLDEDEHEARRKDLYLTYSGLLRVLYSSRNANTRKFLRWVTNVVYTAHMGTKSQKEKQAASLIGVSKDTIKDVFSRCAVQMSCIYLIYLGTTKELRQVLNIGDEYDDKQKVYKFGRTDNLSRRMNEHSKKYGDIGCKVELVRFSPIDPSYTADAESDIKSFFSGLGFNLDNTSHVEITIFGDNHKKVVNNQYEIISDRYMGKYKDIKHHLDIIITQHESKISNVKSEFQGKLIESQDELIKTKQALIDAERSYMAKLAECKTKHKIKINRLKVRLRKSAH